MIHIYPVATTVTDEAMPPGAYVASITPHEPLRVDRASERFDARAGRALFIVRPSVARAALLVVLPLFTYHAYNVADVDPLRGGDPGRCLYTGARDVSLRRPGGGIGGHLWDERNVDVYDRSSPRHTFAHWDAKALAWLQSHGYSYDLCTDLDLHHGTFDLSAYRAMASFGHHEYWTVAMRQRVDAFVDGGGNVAFFGGNTMWFRVTYDEPTQTIARDGKWGDEWKTTGVTYACGGGRWIGTRPATPFVVVQPRHPIFEGLDVRAGVRFGTDSAVVGYECDGVPPRSDLDVLAHASLRDWPQADECGERAPHGHVALGIRRQGNGEVFTASTADWARTLGADRAVATITHNVLDRFGARLGARYPCSKCPPNS